MTGTFTLPPETSIAFAHLQVADLMRALAFYVDLLGFKEIQRDGSAAQLSASGKPPALLVLSEVPGALRQPRRSTGLYHIAIRLPGRVPLARVFRNLVDNRWPFYGASDHLVSQALYLADDDGLGLELYCDRPRSQWPVQNGQVAMGSVELDLDALLAEADNTQVPWSGIDPATDIGHIHLQASDLSESERFYHDLLGMDVTQRTYPGALFLSAGGYHHHIGMNTWNSRGAPPAPPEAVGLQAFGLRIPEEAARQALVERLKAAGQVVEERQQPGYGDVPAVFDQDRNRVVLV